MYIKTMFRFILSSWNLDFKEFMTFRIIRIIKKIFECMISFAGIFRFHQTIRETWNTKEKIVLAYSFCFCEIIIANLSTLLCASS